MKPKSLQKLRSFIAIFAIFIYIAGFLGFFYPIKLFDINILPLIQRVLIDFSLFSVFLLFFIIILTALYGRIYCSTLCPLGLFQELCMILFHKRKNTPSKNSFIKYFIATISFGILIGGTVIVIRLIDPYTIFSSAMSGTIFGIVTISIIALITSTYGRYFCSHICPVGTILGLISKHAYNKIYINPDACVACGLCSPQCPVNCIDFKNKTVNNETCIKCFKCLTICHNQGLTYGHQKKQTNSPTFSPTRRRFILSATTFATLLIAYKAGINLASNIVAKIKNTILPAGAGSAERFANKCLNCNLCVENCPMKILKKKNNNFPAVHIEYGKNFCSYNCNKCSEICPSGAIKRQTLEEKRKTQIALANVNQDICIQCGLCVMECPRSAITKQQGDFPIINHNICIGCGACQAVCPVTAIKVIPVETQKTLSK